MSGTDKPEALTRIFDRTTKGARKRDAGKSNDGRRSVLGPEASITWAAGVQDSESTGRIRPISAVAYAHSLHPVASFSALTYGKLSDLDMHISATLERRETHRDLLAETMERMAKHNDRLKVEAQRLRALTQERAARTIQVYWRMYRERLKEQRKQERRKRSTWIETVRARRPPPPPSPGPPEDDEEEGEGEEAEGDQAEGGGAEGGKKGKKKKKKRRGKKKSKGRGKAADGEGGGEAATGDDGTAGEEGATGDEGPWEVSADLTGGEPDGAAGPNPKRSKKKKKKKKKGGTAMRASSALRALLEAEDARARAGPDISDEELRLANWARRRSSTAVIGAVEGVGNGGQGASNDHRDGGPMSGALKDRDVVAGAAEQDGILNGDDEGDNKDGDGLHTGRPSRVVAGPAAAADGVGAGGGADSADGGRGTAYIINEGDDDFDIYDDDGDSEEDDDDDDDEDDDEDDGVEEEEDEGEEEEDEDVDDEHGIGVNQYGDAVGVSVQPSDSAHVVPVISPGNSNDRPQRQGRGRGRTSPHAMRAAPLQDDDVAMGNDISNSNHVDDDDNDNEAGGPLHADLSEGNLSAVTAAAVSTRRERQRRQSRSVSGALPSWRPEIPDMSPPLRRRAQRIRKPLSANAERTPRRLPASPSIADTIGFSEAGACGSALVPLQSDARNIPSLLRVIDLAAMLPPRRQRSLSTSGYSRSLSLGFLQLLSPRLALLRGSAMRVPKARSELSPLMLPMRRVRSSDALMHLATIVMPSADDLAGEEVVPLVAASPRQGSLSGAAEEEQLEAVEAAEGTPGGLSAETSVPKLLGRVPGQGRAPLTAAAAVVAAEEEVLVTSAAAVTGAVARLSYSGGGRADGRASGAGAGVGGIAARMTESEGPAGSGSHSAPASPLSVDGGGGAAAAASAVVTADIMNRRWDNPPRTIPSSGHTLAAGVGSSRGSSVPRVYVRSRLRTDMMRAEAATSPGGGAESAGRGPSGQHTTTFRFPGEGVLEAGVELAGEFSYTSLRSQRSAGQSCALEAERSAPALLQWGPSSTPPGLPWRYRADVLREVFNQGQVDPAALLHRIMTPPRGLRGRQLATPQAAQLPPPPPHPQSQLRNDLAQEVSDLLRNPKKPHGRKSHTNTHSSRSPSRSASPDPFTLLASESSRLSAALQSSSGPLLLSVLSSARCARSEGATPLQPQLQPQPGPDGGAAACAAASVSEFGVVLEVGRELAAKEALARWSQEQHQLQQQHHHHQYQHQDASEVDGWDSSLGLVGLGIGPGRGLGPGTGATSEVRSRALSGPAATQGSVDALAGWLKRPGDGAHPSFSSAGGAGGAGGGAGASLGGSSSVKEVTAAAATAAARGWAAASAPSASSPPPPSQTVSRPSSAASPTSSAPRPPQLQALGAAGWPVPGVAPGGVSESGAAAAIGGGGSGGGGKGRLSPLPDPAPPIPTAAQGLLSLSPPLPAGLTLSSPRPRTPMTLLAPLGEESSAAAAGASPFAVATLIPRLSSAGLSSSGQDTAGAGGAAESRVAPGVVEPCPYPPSPTSSASSYPSTRASKSQPLDRIKVYDSGGGPVSETSAAAAAAAGGPLQWGATRPPSRLLRLGREGPLAGRSDGGACTTESTPGRSHGGRALVDDKAAADGGGGGATSRAPPLKAHSQGSGVRQADQTAHHSLSGHLSIRTSSRALPVPSPLAVNHLTIDTPEPSPGADHGGSWTPTASSSPTHAAASKSDAAAATATSPTFWASSQPAHLRAAKAGGAGGRSPTPQPTQLPSPVAQQSPQQRPHPTKQRSFLSPGGKPHAAAGSGSGPLQGQGQRHAGGLPLAASYDRAGVLDDLLAPTPWLQRVSVAAPTEVFGTVPLPPPPPPPQQQPQLQVYHQASLQAQLPQLLTVQSLHPAQGGLESRGMGQLESMGRGTAGSGKEAAPRSTPAERVRHDLTCAAQQPVTAAVALTDAAAAANDGFRYDISAGGAGGSGPTAAGNGLPTVPPPPTLTTRLVVRRPAPVLRLPVVAASQVATQQQQQQQQQLLLQHMHQQQQAKAKLVPAACLSAGNLSAGPGAGWPGPGAGTGTTGSFVVGAGRISPVSASYDGVLQAESRSYGGTASPAPRSMSPESYMTMTMSFGGTGTASQYDGLRSHGQTSSLSPQQHAQRLSPPPLLQSQQQQQQPPPPQQPRRSQVGPSPPQPPLVAPQEGSRLPLAMPLSMPEVSKTSLGMPLLTPELSRTSLAAEGGMSPGGTPMNGGSKAALREWRGLERWWQAKGLDEAVVQIHKQPHSQSRIVYL